MQTYAIAYRMSKRHKYDTLFNVTATSKRRVVLKSLLLLEILQIFHSY